MKTAILSFSIILFFNFNSISQINPIQNLEWTHWYEFGNNFFKLEWDEPEEPHDEIVGYNIYQENDLFITINDETSIYNINSPIYGIISNCGGESFLFYENGDGFNAHVTVVYENGEESGFYETVYVEGPLLNTTDYKEKTVILYPNPSTGIINIQNLDFEKIKIYDYIGREIQELKFHKSIDLSHVSKGIYYIEFLKGTQTYIQKLLIE